jgi:hypothetical protein
MIPIFLIFVPCGYLLILKQRNFKKGIIVLFSITLAAPAIYAFSVASDTRFLFSFYPIFCIVSAVAMKSFANKICIEKRLIVFVLFAVLITSAIYLDYKKIDIEHEKESLELAKIVVSETEKINLYMPESQYLALAEFDKIKSFPIIRSDFSIPYHLTDYGFPINTNFDSIDQAVKYFKENDVTHLVIDENESELGIISNVFQHEKEFPFLEKVYDSSEHGYNYSLKIFQINYDEFDNSIILYNENK